jgi:Holliday junction resolvasome RuvABC endonuclease subunit
MHSRYLIAIDPSLTCSGWSLVDIASGRLIGVGEFRGLPPQLPIATRLYDLQSRIRQLFTATQLGVNDVLICEAPTTVRDPSSSFKVEQVRCIFEILGREFGLNVPGRINPRSVHYELFGLKGKQLPRQIIKGMAQELVKREFANDLKSIMTKKDFTKLDQHQDVIDAVLIARLACAWIKQAEQAGEALADFFHSRTAQSRRVRSCAVRSRKILEKEKISVVYTVR